MGHRKYKASLFGSIARRLSRRGTRFAGQTGFCWPNRPKLLVGRGLLAKRGLLAGRGLLAVRAFDGGAQFAGGAGFAGQTRLG